LLMDLFSFLCLLHWWMLSFFEFIFD
jgi:hypothetical protein